MPLATLPGPTAIQGSTALTTFKVKVGGNELEGILSIQIDNSFNNIPKAYVLVEDGDVATQNFQKSERDYMLPGGSIEITVGYNSDEEVLFKGELVAQKIKVTRTGKTRLELLCKDVTYKMAIGKKSKYFIDVTEKEVFEELISGYDEINGEYDSTTLSHTLQLKYPSLIQHNVTDWDYLVARAEQSSSIAYVNEGKIKLHGIPIFKVPAFGLEFGRDIIAMDIELDAEHQYQNVKTISWDEKTHAILESDAATTNLPNQGNSSNGEQADVNKTDYVLRHSGNISQQQLQFWANGKQMRSELSRIRGTLSFQGSHLAKPGIYITIGGAGGRFNGPCLITGVNHTIQRGDWVTTVQIGFDPQWHVEKHLELEIMERISTGATQGFYTGIVKQIEGDPQENNRILVNIPLIQDDNEGTWMRIASFDASENKGFVCHPEIEDEVVVGFLNNDINQGVVVGALFSQKHPGSELLPHSDENNKKGWVLKEDMHLIFDTEEDIVELVTAKGNKILIDQETIEISDQHNNKVVMESSGISCSSDKDISIKAGGKLTLEGNEIELKASMALKAKGSTANFEGNSMTTIKGNPVNIN